MRILSKQVLTTNYYYKGPIICLFCYKRTYHSTPILFDKNETTPPKKEADKKVADDTAQLKAEAPGALGPNRVRRPKFKLWLHNEGKNFINIYDRPNYLGTNIPFPMNPLFKPQPPLNDNAKEEIFLKFTQAEQTPREIATKYGISLKRVEAILKLKKMEKDMIKTGVTLQEILRENIEKMLGARSFRVEPLTDTLLKIGKPSFEIIDENQDFSPEDAAKKLRRPALSKIRERERSEELLRPFSLDEKSAREKQMTLVGRDEKETNQRFQFKFKVVGKEQNVILRDRDGSLYEIKKELVKQH